MKVLTVHAHMERQSFNAALLARACEVFAARGWPVQVSDLYAMGFDPVARPTDFKERADPHFLRYDQEQRAAWAAKGFADDIAAEIEKLIWCDLLILQFPLWWFSVPAILKGWIDRVFALDFAYGGGRWYDKGGLAGRRAMISTTMAAWPQMMAPDGINGDIDVNLWPLQNGVLAFCGFEVLNPFIANAVTYVDDAARRDILDAYGRRLMAIETESPRQFHRRGDFDRNWKLKPEVTPRTVGHHFATLSADALAELKK